MKFFFFFKFFFGFGFHLLGRYHWVDGDFVVVVVDAAAVTRRHFFVLCVRVLFWYQPGGQASRWLNVKWMMDDLKTKTNGRTD